MTPADAAEVLARVAARDNRHVTHAVAIAWSEDLDPRMTIADATALVHEHFATSTEWLMPAHLNRAYKALRARRLNAAIEPPPPEHVRNDPAAELAWRRTWRTRIADGHDPQKALT